MPPDPAGRSGALLGAVLQHAPVTVFITDAAGRVVSAQGQGLHALGLTESDLVGQVLADLAGGWGDARGLFAQALAGQPASSTVCWGERHVRLHLQPGPAAGVTGVALDITSQVLAARHAEALLQLSEMLDDTESHPTLHGALCAALEALTQVIPLDFLILWERQGAEYRAAAWYGALPGAMREYVQQGLPPAAVLARVPDGAPVSWWGPAVPPVLQAMGVAGVAILPLPGGHPAAPTLLCAYRAPPARPWAEHDLVLLRAAARSIAVLQTRRRHRQELEAAALTDPLTGLANRRAFDQDVPAALARARQRGAPLSVVILDIDGLKRVNDTAGHDRGDELLRTFGHALCGVLRTGDRCYRLGGDEFAALLPGAGVEATPALLGRLERIRALLRHGGFPEADASGGVAVYPDEAGTAGALLRLADQRMYHDKASHRRRQEPAVDTQGEA